MTLWSVENFDLSDLAELLALGNDPESCRPPRAACRRSCARPCSSRTRPVSTFVQAIQVPGGWAAVNDALRPDAGVDRADPPSGGVRQRTRRRSTSTCPTTWPTSSATAGRSPLEDTFGEFQLGIWLREVGRRRRRRRDRHGRAGAATGWPSIDGPDDAWAVVVDTAWDSATDADEFADAAQTAVDGLANPAQISRPPDDRR